MTHLKSATPPANGAMGLIGFFVGVGMAIVAYATPGTEAVALFLVGALLVIGGGLSFLNAAFSKADDWNFAPFLLLIVGTIEAIVCAYAAATLDNNLMLIPAAITGLIALYGLLGLTHGK